MQCLFAHIIDGSERENVVTEFSDVSMWILPSNAATKLKILLNYI